MDEERHEVSGEARDEASGGQRATAGGQVAAPGYVAGNEATDDRIRVLRMVQQGKLTPEDAVKLLEAMGPQVVPGRASWTEDPGAGAYRAEQAGWRPGYVGEQHERVLHAAEEKLRMARLSGKTLRIRVVEDGEDRVRLNIPLGLARSALRLLPRSASRYMEGIDLEALVEQIEHGAAGKILEVMDEDETGVEITVE